MHKIIIKIIYVSLMFSLCSCGEVQIYDPQKKVPEAAKITFIWDHEMQDLIASINSVELDFSEILTVIYKKARGVKLEGTFPNNELKVIIYKNGDRYSGIIEKRGEQFKLKISDKIDRINFKLHGERVRNVDVEPVK